MRWDLEVEFLGCLTYKRFSNNNKTMHRLTITISFILFAVILCSSQEKQKLKIKANWKIGETKEMTQLKTHSWAIKGEESDVSILDTVAIYSINVINKFQSGYFVKWDVITDFGENDFSNEFDFIKTLLNKYEYVIETDSNGNYVDLRNWDYLIILNKLLRNQIIALAKKEGVKQNEVNSNLSTIPLPKTKEEQVEMCQNLTSIFHSIYGQDFVINDTLIEYKHMDNPNIPEGIPYFQTTIASSLENGKISIKYIIEYDYVENLRLLKKYFPDQDYYGEEKTFNYSEYIYNQYSGWIEKITIYLETDNEYGKNVTKIDYIFE
jgi:hypothetical protein